MTETIWTVNTIKDAVRATGSHWFDPSTMRFFGTRILPTVYQGNGGIYFVTSEQPPHGPRQYSVRKFTPDGADISTIGEVARMTKGQAVKLAKKSAGDKVAECVEDFRPVGELEQFLDECRQHGDIGTHVEQCRNLIRWGKKHHKAMEDYCNGVEVYDEEGEPTKGLKQLRQAITDTAAAIGAKGVVFGGDPRGCTVKLVWHNGETNDFGKDGWCVPGA